MYTQSCWRLYSLIVLVLLAIYAPVHVQAYYPEIEDSSITWQQLLPVIEQYLEALRKGKTEDAYRNYTTKKLQEITPYADFEKLLKEAPVIQNNKLFKFQSFYFEDGIAIFQGALVSAQGESMQTEFDLKKEASTWKIDGFHLFKPEIIMPPQQYIQDANRIHEN